MILFNFLGLDVPAETINLDASSKSYLNKLIHLLETLTKNH